MVIGNAGRTFDLGARPLVIGFADRAGMVGCRLDFRLFQDGAVGAAAAVKATVDEEHSLEVGAASTDIAFLGIACHSPYAGEEVDRSLEGGS